MIKYFKTIVNNNRVDNHINKFCDYCDTDRSNAEVTLNNFLAEAKKLLKLDLSPRDRSRMLKQREDLEMILSDVEGFERTSPVRREA